jgi:hypothetical protein
VSHRLLRQGMANIQLDLNKRPPCIGLPGSGGQPEEHVELADGLGKTIYVFNDMCHTVEVSGTDDLALHDLLVPFSLHYCQKLRSFLEYRYRGYPGERRIARGHYELYCTNFKHPQKLTAANWASLVVPGCKVAVAFVVGTWQMTCLNWCPGCNTSQRGPWDVWRYCPCGYTYYVTQLGQDDEEPIDGFWCGKQPKTLKDWQKSAYSPIPPEEFFENDSGHSQRLVDVETERSASHREDDEETKYAVNPYDEEEDYFRTMIMVHDPIFNFVCRNIFCQCALGYTSISSNAPCINLPTAIPCPNHASTASRFCEHALHPSEKTAQGDAYFDQFKGRTAFLYGVAQLYQGTIVQLFIDMSKVITTLPPTFEVDEDSSSSPYTTKPWLEYRAKVLGYVEVCWHDLLKQKSQAARPDLIPVIEEWICREQAKTSRYAASNETGFGFVLVHNHRAKVAALSHGQCTIEDLDDVWDDPEYAIVV